MFLYFRKKISVVAIVEAFGGDPYWANVDLLMHMDGANGSTNLIDEKGSPVSVISAVVLNSAVKKFGNASAQISGGSALINSAIMGYGTGDFTLECWIHPTANPTATGQFFLVSGSAGNSAVVFGYNTTSWGIAPSGGTWKISSTTLPTLNQWNHVAITRQSGTLRQFLNGNLLSTVANDTTNFVADTSYIGHPLFGNSILGYIEEIRSTKGIARYTGNFSVPTAAFPSQALPNWEPVWGKTVLLLKGNGNSNGNNNTFLDSSSNNTVTRFGNVSQGAYSPVSIPEGYWSAYFDGINDYLQLPLSTEFDFVDADFTIEFWYNKTSASSPGTYTRLFNASGDTWCGISICDSGANGSLRFSVSFANTYVFSGVDGPVLPIGQWVHLALVRSGSVFKYYINGVGTSILVDSRALHYNSGVPYAIGGQSSGAARFINGYLSNFRVSRGSAHYTADFIPPSSPLTAVPGATLLTCQSNRFKDNSANALAITAFGDTKVTTDTPFNNQNEIVMESNPYSSIYFDGVGDRLTYPASSNWNLGNTYTIEFWLNYQTLPVGAWGRPFLIGSNGSSSALTIQVSTSGNVGLSIPNSGVNNFYLGTVAGVATVGWQHFAFVNNVGTASIYRNGVLISQGLLATQVGTASNNLYIGYDTVGTVDAQLKGWISNLRIVKGTAVYTAAFAPPTTALTAITNTVLLTAQSDTIKDNSQYGAIATVTGNAIVSQVSPFGLSTSIGSSYFDGSGDYLNIPASTNYTFGTGDFTVELYIFKSTAAINQTAIAKWDGGGTGWGLMWYGSTNINWLNSSGGSIISDPAPFPIGQWVHVAVVRSSGILKLFVNGLQVASLSNSLNHSSSTAPLIVGALDTSGNFPFAGFLSNVRITKGFARYTANFVPSIVASDANTSLLLNFNNGQIVDSTGRNVIETVNNAKIASTKKITGSGSIYFGSTSDYLNIQTSENFSFPGDFTVEAWSYLSAATGTYAMVLACGNIHLRYGDSGFGYRLQATVGPNGGDVLNSVHTASSLAGQWVHTALVRQNGIAYFYVNGVLASSVGCSTNFAANPITVGASSGGIYKFSDGFLSNVRITKGFARYTANFVPRMSDLPAKQLTSVEYDPYWNNVVLSMNMDGGDNGTSFIDAKGKTITRSGAVTKTDNKVFGTTSAYFPVANYKTNVVTATSTDFNFDTSDLTMECWYKPEAKGNLYPVIICNYNNWVNGAGAIAINDRHAINDTKFTVFLNTGNSSAITSITTPINGTWYHLALTRSGNLWKFFVNGVLEGSATVSFTARADSVLNIGNTVDTTLPATGLNGWVDDVRVTKGVARYTTNFTVPAKVNPQQ